LLDGYNTSLSSTPSTVVLRNSESDINVRLVRSEYADQSTISGGIVFRTNSTTDNYLRICNDPAAIRTFLGAQASGSYITAEVDTLATVTGRGSSTTTIINSKRRNKPCSSG